jgi:hypothetical protein
LEDSNTKIPKYTTSTPYTQAFQAFQALDYDNGDDNSHKLESNVDPSTLVEKHPRLEALVRNPLPIGLLDQPRSSNHPKASTSYPWISQLPTPVHHLHASTFDPEVPQLPTLVCHPHATSTTIGVSSSPLQLKEHRQRTFWIADEINALTCGVEQFGKANWRKIKDTNPIVLLTRTEIDLKDKWHNLEKSRLI